MKLKKLNLSEIQNEFQKIEKNEQMLFIGRKKIYFTIVCLLFVAFGGVNCFAQNEENVWKIADNDTVYLMANDAMSLISGFVAKAIDPQYIANRNGWVKENFDSGKKPKIELIFFNPNLTSTNVNAINAAKLWDYYVMDELTTGYSRALVSALMPHAIDEIEYDTDYAVPFYRLNKLVHIRVRDVSKVKISDESTLYLLNDTVITRKIFDALNPVYIRSLQRITDRKQLAKYGKKNTAEVVLIETGRISNCRES